MDDQLLTEIRDALNKLANPKKESFFEKWWKHIIMVTTALLIATLFGAISGFNEIKDIVDNRTNELNNIRSSVDFNFEAVIDATGVHPKLIKLSNNNKKEK